MTRRPPSPSYLCDPEAASPSLPANDDTSADAMPLRKEPKKEKRGLMSRKMMLLRSRTASAVNTLHAKEDGSETPRVQTPAAVDFIPSSPILQDVGKLAPEPPETQHQHIPETPTESLQVPETDQRTPSRLSSASEISGLAGFLAKYGKADGVSDDEAPYASEDNGPAPGASASEVDAAFEAEASAERRRRQRDEYNSAVLSKRAEEILANAKKRLNVMEGNLRGARDLVAPLTAANLKRATSVGSASTSPSYGRSYMAGSHDYDDPVQHSHRRVHTQTSSPLIGRDYHSHARGLSEAEMPERPYTAMDSPQDIISRNVQSPMRRAERSPDKALRGSRSYDSLGASSGVGYGVGYGVGRDRLVHTRESPDPHLLEPLHEADERRSPRSSGSSNQPFANNGLGIYRPSSRTSDLREQMTTLKGKISTLKERAREDSMRRQSNTSLRNSSPFNNALTTAPELFYTTSDNFGSPGLDSNAGVGQTPDGKFSGSRHVRDTSFDSSISGITPILSGSRNAFAEQAAQVQARVVEIVASKTPDSKFQVRRPKEVEVVPPAHLSHKRTPSGTAIIDSAKKRYSHHQYSSSADMPGAYVSTPEEDEYLEVPSPGLTHDGDDSSPASSEESPKFDQEYVPSEDGTSIYEDAKSNQTPEIAHEDRDDAFDYESFFLHSAMTAYDNRRRGSTYSEASNSSAETARGPALAQDHEYNGYDQHSGLEAPPTPETPERLREIERNLHKRTVSQESVSTMNTFATADEAQVSPLEEHMHQFVPTQRAAVSPLENDAWQFRPASRIPARPDSRGGSRPSSRRGITTKLAVRRDSGSDRADSGVGIPHRSTGSIGTHGQQPGVKSGRKIPNRSVGSVASPPVSPRAVSSQDPAAVAVNALLDPYGNALGLRNNATLFGVVESLRLVVQHLQRDEETGYESRLLRKRLDDAKAVLEGRVLR